MSYLILTYLLIESFLYYYISQKRKSFKWLITYADQYPEFPRALVEKYLLKSFDPDLGWVRKPNTSGQEKGKFGSVSFSIDEIGSRENPASVGKPVHVSVYGDSFAFCRQVNDDETFEFYLADKYGVGVSNYGVGNYGIDQAILRMEKNMGDDSEIVVLVFVPETIIRIHSSRKHYCEYGNILGFKPRYKLDDLGRLVLSKNVLTDPVVQLENSKKLIKNHFNDDYFYRSFNKNRVDFPPLLSGFMKNNLSRTASILYDLYKLNNNNSSEVVDEVMLSRHVIKRNTKIAHDMYYSSDAKRLLEQLLERFVSMARSRNKRPFAFVVPQYSDMLARKELQRSLPYESFFDQISEKISVKDFTAEFSEYAQLEELYVNDVYGGHLSPVGCEFLSELIANNINLEGVS